MWNPTTTEVHRIPSTLCINNESVLYGFGADGSISINFKVVKLHTGYGRTAEVYSLNTKSWIPTQNLPPFTITTSRNHSKYNTLVNYVYHWITNNPVDCISYEGADILCFDFRNNQFQGLKGPAFSYEDHNFLYDDIAEINGSLAYVVQCRLDAPVHLKIWVMDQSGWDKKYNIDRIAPLFLMRGLWKNGTQLLGGEAGKLLTSYDLQGNTLCQFQIHVDYDKFWIHEYIPSIVPLARRRHYHKSY